MDLRNVVWKSHKILMYSACTNPDSSLDLKYTEIFKIEEWCSSDFQLPLDFSWPIENKVENPCTDTAFVTRLIIYCFIHVPGSYTVLQNMYFEKNQNKNETKKQNKTFIFLFVFFFKCYIHWDKLTSIYQGVSDTVVTLIYFFLNHIGWILNRENHWSTVLLGVGWQTYITR